MMHPVRFSLMLDLGAVLISLATASPVVAEEEAAHCPGKLETLNASYAGQLRDVGQKLCELACKDNTPPALKNHFEARIVRLDLLGEPAPAISGTEVQGHQVSLADLKGKVVLVDLRQSWYFRCAASIAACYPLAQKYHRQGVVILRVNVDPRCRDFGCQDGPGRRWPVPPQGRREMDQSVRSPDGGKRRESLRRERNPRELPDQP
jgi:hypothetical protein